MWPRFPPPANANGSTRFSPRFQCGDEQIRRKSHGIVRVDIRELDSSSCVHDEDCWNRKLVMSFSRSSFKINSVLFEALKRWLINLISNPECLGSFHAGIGQKSRMHAVLRLSSIHRRYYIWSDRNPLKARIFNFSLDISQFAQLPVAVGSPTPPIKYDHSRRVPHRGSQVKFTTVLCIQDDRRNHHSCHQRTHLRR